MKKFITLLMALILTLSFTACNNEPESSGGSNDKNVSFDGLLHKTEESNFVTTEDGNQALVSGEFRLEFVKSGNNYSYQIVDVSTLNSHSTSATAKSVTFKSNNPITVRARTGRDTTDKNESEFSSSYSYLQKADYGYYAEGEVSTDKGSAFSVVDRYYIQDEGVFNVYREVKVLKVGNDAGYQSLYSVSAASGSTSYKDFEYFIPSILYKDSSDMTSLAIGKSLNVNSMMVKETRTGLPMAMLKEKNGGTLSIAHTDIDISVNGETGDKYFVNNDKLQYGSIGYKIKKGASVDFCYPCSEGPTTYDASSGWSKIYHEVKEGGGHSYTLSIIPDNKESFTDAMAYAYQKAYMAENPEITDKVDIDEIYEDNIVPLKGEYKAYGTESFGWPWSVHLNGNITEGYSFQMGFVGMHTELGYQLVSYGKMKNDSEAYQMGVNVLDMWADFALETTLPRVWINPSATGPKDWGYPSFLRCFTDGMEGLLNGYLNEKNDGTVHQNWINAVLKTADFLVNNQNEDGSYYRAYEYDGSVCVRENENKQYQGESKYNTTCAVRFLAKVYDFTNEAKYKNAALRAADYCYDVLYVQKGKYVGGTPDNPNVVDKEASSIALYAFNAAYQLTKEEKYLNAAKHAAVSALSWVYVYDFAIPNQPSGTDEGLNAFETGGTIGFSIIATGHSAADNYSAIMYYEFFKLYVWTGDIFYRDAALLLQQNTKLCCDYDGSVGYKYKCMAPEATVCADFAFKSVNVWLFWSDAANILPIAEMRSCFGNADINKLSSDLSVLRNELNEYGFGSSKK